MHKFIVLLISAFGATSAFAAEPATEEWCKRMSHDIKGVFYDQQNGKSKEEVKKALAQKQTDPFSVSILSQMTDAMYEKAPKFNDAQERDAFATLIVRRSFNDCLKAVDKVKNKPVS